MRLKRLMVFVLLIVATLVLSACDLSLFASKYAVEGRVTDADGQGLEGVSIKFGGGISGTTQTDADGNWTMNELKGLVTVTAIKDGWAFSPATISVEEAKTDVNFIGKLSEQAGAEQVVTAFCQNYEGGNAQAMVDLFSDSYFVNNGITRADLLSDINGDLQENDYLSVDFIIDYSLSTFELDRAVVKGELVMEMKDLLNEKIYNENSYLALEIVKTPNGWKIADIYDFSPQEAEISVLVQEFCNALINEDLAAISSMLGSRLQDGFFLSSVETSFSDYDVNYINVDNEDISNYDGTNMVVINGTINVTSAYGTSDQDLFMYLEYVNENGSWLLNSVAIYGDTYYISG